MLTREQLLYRIAWVLAGVFVVAAVLYRVFAPGVVVPGSPRSIPEVGETGSDHRHATMLIAIGDRVVDFCKPEYMLKSQLVHFEDDNCIIVHKHARGVTFPVFLKTIGVSVTEKCITIPGEQKRCADGVYRIALVLNGAEVSWSDFQYREILDDDRLLINFGAEEGPYLLLKYNQVPPVPEFVRKTSKDAQKNAPLTP